MNEQSEMDLPAAAPARASRKKGSAEPASFEEAMARLEALVRKMESGNEDLGAMVSSFEEGQKLLAYCGKTLSEIERKVEILTKRADGSVAAEPFAESPE